MFSTLLLSFWGQQIVAGLIILAMIVVLFTLLVRRTNRVEHRREHYRPIICVCEVNGRIGVVLRDDLHKASREYWKQYYDGRHYDSGHVAAPDGRRLKVEPLFNFKGWSPEYYTICISCYVEQATFDVPAVGKDDPGQIAEAYQYFHGKPWNGELIRW